MVQATFIPTEMREKGRAFEDVLKEASGTGLCRS